MKVFALNVKSSKQKSERKDFLIWRYWDNRIKLLVILPLAHIVAVVYAPQTFSIASLQIFLLTLFLGQIGYTMGYHRYLSHGSFKTNPVMKAILIVLAICAGQDGPLSWASVHRQHHHCSDQEDDPHSPVKSFWHGYLGWALGNPGLLRSPSFYKKWVPDLMKDSMLRFFDQFDLIILSASALLLYLIGGFDFLIWGFFLRLVVGLHLFWILNTMSHLRGSQPWKINDNSRNSFLMGVLVQGEGWHNNHHYMPRSAKHGFKWWQIDVTWYFIFWFEKIGWVWDVVRPYPDMKIKNNLGDR